MIRDLFFNRLFFLHEKTYRVLAGIQGEWVVLAVLNANQLQSSAATKYHPSKPPNIIITTNNMPPPSPPTNPSPAVEE